MLRDFLCGFREQTVRTFVRPRFALMLVLVFGMSFLSMEIYSHLVVRALPVAVIDFDNSKISRAIRVALSSAPEIEVVGATYDTVDQAREALVTSEVAGIVVLPENLSLSIKKGRPARALVAVDMSNILIGKNAYKAIAKVLGTVAAGVEIGLITKLGERAERATSRVIPIAVSDSLALNPATNYAVYIVPALIFFFLHIFVLIMASSVFLPPGEQRGASAVAGGATSVFLLGLACGAVFLYGYLPHATIVPQSDPAVLLAFLAAFVLVDVLMAVAFFAVLPNRVIAFDAVVVLGMLSLMFSGATWPTDMFPELIRWVAAAIPFTPFMVGLRTALHYPAELCDLVSPIAHLSMLAAIFAALAAAGAFIRAILSQRARGKEASR